MSKRQIEVNLEVSAKEGRLINKIVSRVWIVSVAKKWSLDRLSLIMDLSACHLNGCPLDLKGLRDAVEVDLMHDCLGIRRHLDRNTGKLGGCFLPRHAKKVKDVASTS